MKNPMVTWRRFTGVASYYLHAIDELLERNCGISLAETELLIHVRGAGGNLRMAELADRLLITRAGMTKMVDRLHRAGFAERRQDDDDRRAKNVVITRSGRKLLERTRPVLQEWVRGHFLDHLTGAELRALDRAMLRIVAGNGWDDPAADMDSAPSAGGAGSRRRKGPQGLIG